MESSRNIRETGLYDQEVFRLLAEHEISRAQRYPNPVTLLYITLNLDEARPDIANSAKQLFAGILNSSLRISDIPAHFGNDFLALLPSTDENGGVAAGQRLIARLKGTRNFADGKLFKFTVHIGISSHPGGRGIAMDKLLHEANVAMQKAKKIAPQALSVYAR